MSLESGGRHQYRKAKANVMVGLCAVAVLLALVPLGAVLYMIASKGLSMLSWHFLTSLPQSPMAGEGGGGVRNAVIGTVWIVAISCLFSVPIGVLAGVYLNEYGDNAFGRAVRFTTEVLSGLPSIIAGVVVYGVVVIAMGDVSAFAGGVALSLLAVPWITVATEDALALVPQAHRDASLALGVNRTHTILWVVLPSAFGGVVTGTMLAVARVAGETAPLIWTAGFSRFPFHGVFRGTATLSILIYNYATSPYDAWHDVAWGAAVLLVGLILAANVLARALWAARSRSMEGYH